MPPGAPSATPWNRSHRDAALEHHRMMHDAAASCMLLHVRVRTARLYGDDDRRLRAARRSLHRGSRCTDGRCTVPAMKTLIAASLGVCIALPLTAQTSTTAQQLIAARDTVWRAWLAD